MFHSLLSQLMLGTSIIVCGAALILGSQRERIGALYYIAAYLLSVVLGKLGWADLNWRCLMTDGVCLVGMVSLSWKSPHSWPIWASAFELMAVMTEVFNLTQHGLLPWTLLTVVNGCSYLVLLAMFVGTLAAYRRKRDARRASEIG